MFACLPGLEQAHVSVGNIERVFISAASDFRNLNIANDFHGRGWDTNGDFTAPSTDEQALV